MRLDRLDLTAYGHFTGRTLEFPRPAPGEPDLHLIYGPNESGKSTFVSAWLDLVHGIPARSAMAFLHDYETLQIGARLTLPEGVREVVRRKRTPVLSDPQGRPLPEGWLAAAAGGLDREGARAMFTLDDETIERGGEAILEARGELGRLLFAGSAGVAAAAAQLAALRKAAEDFHRPRAHRTALREMIGRLKDIEAQRRAIDVDQAQYDRARRAAAAAAETLATARAAQAAARLRVQSAERSAGAAPLARAWHEATLRLAALDGLPEAPPGAEGFAADAATLATAAALETAHRAAAAAAEAEAEGLADDPAGLALAEGLAAAEAEELPQRRQLGLRDLPRRRAERDRLVAQAAAIAAGLSPGAEPAALRLPVPVLQRLRALIAEGAALQGRLAGAQGAAMVPAPGAVADPGPLSALLDRLRPDPVAAAAEAAAAAARAAAERDRRLAALAPWRGDAAALAALAVPPRAQVEAHAEALARAGRARDEAAAQAAAAAAALARAERAEAARRTVTPPATADLAAARAAREAAWAAHRAALDAATAAAFEAALRHDDALQAERAGAAAEDARRAEAAATLAALRGDAERAAAALAQADAALAAAEAAWRALLAGIDPALPGDWPPAALSDWIARRDAALEAAAAAAEAALAAEAARAAEAAAARDLAALLGADPALGAAVLLAQARAGLEAARTAAAEAKAARRAQEAAEAAAAAWADWSTRWDEARAGTWLAALSGLDPAGWGTVLDRLAELDAVLEKAGDLDQRIAAMEADVAAHDARIAALAAAAGEAAGPDLPVRLAARAAAAVRAREARAAALARAREEREKADAVAAGAAEARARVDAVARALGVAPAEAGALLGRIAERDALRAAVARQATDLAAAGIRDPAALAAADPDAIAAEQEAAVAAAQAADNAVTAAQSAADSARAALEAMGGDDRVARLATARATLMAEVAEGARRHLALTLGLAAVEDGLRLYRERHRSGMLRRASAAFATITRGAYSGLAAEPAEGGGEVLVARAADGRTRGAAQLSKGTRMQLYLALRVAGYHEIAAQRAPMPFIGDDIMETFDDGRAAAAFGALADMARVGQVIYLTHHEHLIALARAACPGLAVHRL
jgi:uncharacterized protein YhaN